MYTYWAMGSLSSHNLGYRSHMTTTAIVHASRTIVGRGYGRVLWSARTILNGDVPPRIWRWVNIEEVRKMNIESILELKSNNSWRQLGNKIDKCVIWWYFWWFDCPESIRHGDEIIVASHSVTDLEVVDSYWFIKVGLWKFKAATLKWLEQFPIVFPIATLLCTNIYW